MRRLGAIRDGLKQILDALFRWKREHHPESPWFFPSPREPGAVVDKSAMAHALARIRPKLPRKITSHGGRAYYVTVRRSHRVMDSQIAWEIGHTSGGATLRRCTAARRRTGWLATGPRGPGCHRGSRLGRCCGRRRTSFLSRFLRPLRKLCALRLIAIRPRRELR